jgi:hypothetical protein
MQNPDSVLAQVPQGEFNSRYADPNHAAASGSLISFVSGGKLIPGPNSKGLIGGLASVISQAARGEKQGAEWERLAAENAQRQQTMRGHKKGLIPGLRTYKKLLAKVRSFVSAHRCYANAYAECVVSYGCEHAFGGRNGGGKSCSKYLRAYSRVRAITSRIRFRCNLEVCLVVQLSISYCSPCSSLIHRVDVWKLGKT